MLSTLALALVLLWLAGMLTAYTLGGLVHVLLLLAALAMSVRIMQGRSGVP